VARSRAEALPEHVEEAMRVLAREAPLHLAALSKELGKLTVSIGVGDASPFAVSFADGPPWVRPVAAPDVDVALSSRDVEDLLAGALTVEDAVARDRLAIRGDVSAVIRFLDALRLWLHGALRSPSMPRLRDTYLADTVPRTYERTSR
jgi:hypothetical protein